MLAFNSLLANASSSANLSTQLNSLDSLSSQLATVQKPTITTPAWVTTQDTSTVTKTVTYSVVTKGAIVADSNEFKADANATLNDSRGWAAMGVRFSEVTSGGMFTLVLAEASQLPVISSGCSALYSCNVGDEVVINQDRWLYATTPWNQAGKSLADYRHMVINHEVGHWLGHGHEMCGGAGQLAPVMEQQSIDLQGCIFNPWPLPHELWSTRLGIKL